MKAYNLISSFYNIRTSARSKVPLINHIDEGLKILSFLNEGAPARQAFCLHPIIQDDKDLAENWNTVCLEMKDEHPSVIMFAMEYRSVANEFLRDRVGAISVDGIRLSPIVAVNNMLIADKVQNRKDFELYHKDTHPNRKELTIYFNMWLEKLDISEAQYQEWIKLL